MTGTESAADGTHVSRSAGNGDESHVGSTSMAFSAVEQQRENDAADLLARDSGRSKNEIQN